MRPPVSVGQQQKLPVAHAKAAQRTMQVRPRDRASRHVHRAVAQFVGQFHRGLGRVPSPAPRVPCQVGGNHVERVSLVFGAFVLPSRPQHPVAGLLQQVVRLRAVAGRADQVGPHARRGALVEGTEGVLGHRERLPFAGGNGQSIHAGQRQVSHGYE